MKILITGCGGMLGSAMYPTMKAFGHEVLPTDLIADEPWLKHLDVRDNQAVEREVDTFEPDAVLHLAAVTDLEWSEANSKAVMATNTDATAAIAALCARKNIRLVYISTAGIFDGDKIEAYDERDIPSPLNVYGLSKWDGEKAIRDELPNHLIVRAGWMFGGERKDHKFVSKIAIQLREGAKVIYGVDDKFGNVTYTKDFAGNLHAILESQVSGTFHMVCGGGTSRYEVAQEIVRQMGYNQVEVRPVSSAFFEQEYFAPRPRSEMMVNRALNEIGLNQMRFWKEAMADYLQTEQLIGSTQRSVHSALLDDR